MGKLKVNFKGYHATERAIASKIRNEGFNFKKGPKFPNDLGEGVYFFVKRSKADSPEENAKNYIYTFRNFQNHKSLLVANINIDDDQLLDLDDEEIQIEFDRVRNLYLEKIKSELDKYPDTWGGKLRGNYDGIVLQILLNIRNMNPDGILKDTYTPILDYKSSKKLGYSISNFPNGRELCVRNENCICVNDISLKMI